MGGLEKSPAVTEGPHVAVGFEPVVRRLDGFGPEVELLGKIDYPGQSFIGLPAAKLDFADKNVVNLLGKVEHVVRDNVLPVKDAWLGHDGLSSIQPVGCEPRPGSN